MTFIAIICGLKSEAQAVSGALGDANIRIGVSGANAQRAEELAVGFCKAGASVVVSVGVSGGLDPACQPGDLVIGDRVITKDGAVYASDLGFLKMLATSFDDPHPEVRADKASLEGCDASTAASGPSFEASAAQKRLRIRDEANSGAKHRLAFTVGSLFGSDEIIASASEKAVLFEKFNCLAVDMESHGAARAAYHAGVPFIAIRAIADPADRALPKAALGAVAPDGSTRVFKTIGAAMRDPGQFPALMKLGSDSSAALKVLRSALPSLFGLIADALKR